MSGDQLDLDAIEASARHWDHLVRDDPETTLALVAEVRRLRDERDRWAAFMAADYGEHPTATSRAEGCSCDACTKFPPGRP